MPLVALLTSRWSGYALAAVAALWLLWTLTDAAAVRATARCRAEHEAARIAEMARQRQASQEASARAAAEESQAEAETARLRRIADALQADLQAANYQCRLPAGVLERLRDIR